MSILGFYQPHCQDPHFAGIHYQHSSIVNQAFQIIYSALFYSAVISRLVDLIDSVECLFHFIKRYTQTFSKTY
jgi:hypothetical protein